jgi:hypothetical protein
MGSEERACWEGAAEEMGSAFGLFGERLTWIIFKVSVRTAL